MKGVMMCCCFVLFLYYDVIGGLSLYFFFQVIMVKPIPSQYHNTVVFGACDDSRFTALLRKKENGNLLYSRDGHKVSIVNQNPFFFNAATLQILNRFCWRLFQRDRHPTLLLSTSTLVELMAFLYIRRSTGDETTGTPLS